MKRKDLFSNYRGICYQDALNKMHLKNFEINKQERTTEKGLKKYSEVLQETIRLKVIQGTMQSVDSFLSTAYDNSIANLRTGRLPRILFNKHQGNSVGVAKYLLQNLNKRILLLSRRPKEFIPNSNNGIVHPSSPVRVLKFDSNFTTDYSAYTQVIIEGIDQVTLETFYNSLPKEHKHKFVSVGG